MTTQALSISPGTGRSRFRHRAVPVLAFTAALLFAAGQPSFADDRAIVVDARIPMTCVPPPPNPPGIGPLPPCPEPFDLDSIFSAPEPSGEARVIVRQDDTARIVIDLDGLAPELVITAWLAYFFPPGPLPDPIFNGLAAVSVPLAPTGAAFTEGLGPEPNQFRLHGNDDAVKGRLVVELDYNPLKAGQGPLRNEAALVTQAAAPPGSGAEQPPCCPNGARPQPIGASFTWIFSEAIAHTRNAFSRSVNSPAGLSNLLQPGSST